MLLPRVRCVRYLPDTALARRASEGFERSGYRRSLSPSRARRANDAERENRNDRCGQCGPTLSGCPSEASAKAAPLVSQYSADSAHRSSLRLTDLDPPVIGTLG